MKTIRIKRLHLTNFKGVRSFEAEFGEKTTTVSGANGTGKTSLFDAFTWLLFGKDSLDRKTFDIKTLGEDGKAIAKLPHEVEAVLDVDGTTITLTRRYEEKWTKKRGEAVEQMTGHEETRLWNNVPMSVKDWGEKIDGICSETVFKYITNPSYFSAQKMEAQRAMLIDMAGSVDGKEVASGNKDFESLLEQLEGKTLEELKKEVSANRKRIKAEVDGIPARIDELERTIAEHGEIDAEAEKKGLQETDAKLTALAGEEASATEAIKAQMRRTEEKRAMINELTARMTAREKALTDEALRSWRTVAEQNAQTERQIAKVEMDIKAAEARKATYSQQTRVLVSQLDTLRAEWRAINAETLTFDEDAFVCPTCKRPLEVEDIEAKQEEMRASFNTGKAARLQANSEKGKATKQEAEQLKVKMTDEDYLIGELTKNLEQLRASKGEDVDMPDTSHVTDDDEEYARLQEQRDGLAETLATPVTTDAGAEERKARRQELTAQRDAHHLRLQAVETIAKTESRIKQLTEQMKDGAQRIADMERIEFTMAQFVKARISTVENKINALFPTVRFKMYEEQINGGEKEVCTATVNGVPYASLNHAGQILAGLEIISAVCKHNGVTAPIFCDNAEAVNAFPSMESQMILLRVTEDKNLKIE